MQIPVGSANLFEKFFEAFACIFEGDALAHAMLICYVVRQNALHTFIEMHAATTGISVPGNVVGLAGLLSVGMPLSYGQLDCIHFVFGFDT